MSIYRNCSPEDAHELMYDEHLEAYPWPDGRSVQGFVTWLWKHGPEHLDTRTLARFVNEYLESDIADEFEYFDHLKEGVQGLQDEIEAFGAAVAAVRAGGDGDEVMRLIAGLAASRDPVNHLAGIHTGWWPSIYGAMQTLSVAGECFNNYFYDSYVPGRDDVEDYFVQSSACYADEVIRRADPYSGREEYQQLEVLALVRLTHNFELRTALALASSTGVSVVNADFGPASLQ